MKTALLLISNPHINGLVSFLFRGIANILLSAVVIKQVQQFETRRLYRLKAVLLALTVSAIVLSFPAMLLQAEKTVFGSYPEIHGYIASLSNAASLLIMAICMTIVYFKKER